MTQNGGQMPSKEPKTRKRDPLTVAVAEVRRLTQATSKGHAKLDRATAYRDRLTKKLNAEIKVADIKVNECLRETSAAEDALKTAQAKVRELAGGEA